jgi:hypothetical protein
VWDPERVGPEHASHDDVAETEKLVRLLERGSIAFVVRPRVEGAPGVQRFLFTLSPERGALHRRVHVGRKRMPAPGKSEREWAYVDKLARAQSGLIDDLGPSTYLTKTRGERHQPGAHVIARGRYAILEHGEHTHLTYTLDPDVEREPLHDALNVAPAASLITAVFNPLASWRRRGARGSPPLPGLPEEEASPFREPSLYPDELQARFGRRRFAPLDPTFLDHEGAEIVLIGAEDEVRPELAVAV